MRKIMFSDAYGLTQAVLDDRKTQTRRIVSERLWDRWTEYDDYCDSVGVSGLSETGVSVTREYYGCEKFFLDNAPYKVGEVVAVAQSYKDAGVHFLPEEDDEFGCHNFPAEQTSGWNNKMFTRAALMPHHIRITDVRVERLNDISDEDCIAEGIREVEVSNNWGNSATHAEYRVTYQDKFSRERMLIGMTPREAYAALIDKISGKGTWESNPYVFAYTFKLVK